MIKDRLTASVLGLVIIVFSVLIDVSILILTPKDSIRVSRGAFLLLTVVPSLPFILAGGWLLRKAKSLPDESDD